MTPRTNTAIFNPRKNYQISLVTFWASVVLCPVTMISRGLLTHWDLFEQVLLFISWYALIETSRNSVITSAISKRNGS